MVTCISQLFLLCLCITNKLNLSGLKQNTFTSYSDVWVWLQWVCQAVVWVQECSMCHFIPWPKRKSNSHLWSADVTAEVQERGAEAKHYQLSTCRFSEQVLRQSQRPVWCGSIPCVGNSTKGREGREIVNNQHNIWAPLVAQTVKNLPAMPETWVWNPGSGRSPGTGTATHSSTLAWRIPCVEEPGRL